MINLFILTVEDVNTVKNVGLVFIVDKIFR